MRKFKDIETYQKHFLLLIEKERKIQKDFHLQEIKRLSPRERERRGRAILDLNAKYKGDFLSYRVYRFGRKFFPEHQLQAGDVVLVSLGNPLKRNQEGIVKSVGANFIEILLGAPIMKGKKYRIDLFVNDITFKRMEDAVKRLSEDEYWRDFLLGIKETQSILSDEPLSLGEDDFLNPTQKEAVKRALTSQIFLIHGPPGTGKTTTLVGVIKNLRDKKLLVTADSNVAVDNILEKFIDEKVVRIGNPVRISAGIMEKSLEFQMAAAPEYKKVEELEEKINKLKDRQLTVGLKPSPAFRRGMSDDEIKRKASLGRSFRGVSSEKISKMARWLEIQEKINLLYQEKEKIQEQIVQEIISNAWIVFATNSSAGSEILEGYRFDCLIHDEATQSVEPSSLIPLLKTKRVILAGDHHQLPPTVLSPEAEDLKVTLFERWISHYPQNKVMLNIQYRMNKKIAQFSSTHFYEGKIQTPEEIANITLGDLISIEGLSSLIGGDVPLIWIDTRGKSEEESKADSPSFFNKYEGELVVKIVEELLKKGLDSSKIGVITPYKDQEEFIRQLLKNQSKTEIEIKSVDGYQGREKEVIILSLVRSNQEQEIGFLKDYRRLNVALTRAKRKLILIGDSYTLTQYPLYKDLFSYVYQIGVIC